MADEIKHVFQKLPDDKFSEEQLEKALQRVKNNEEFRRRNYGKYRVFLCGDHDGNEINILFLEKLKNEMKSKYGINCYIGKDYIKIAKGSREKEIQSAYLENADIILFIDGKSPGTLNESNYIRENKILNSKTLAFFKYAKYEELIEKPDKQDYISEFKYPIPYKELDELAAKTIFGTKHMILYFLNKKLNEQETDSNSI